MQLYKFFVLKTPEDLLRKLERECNRWKADPLNVDFAWNFFITAEHLPDWVYYQDMPTSGKERPDLLDGETPYEFKMALKRPVLRICSHLANGAKHFHLRNSNLASVASMHERPRAFFEPGAFIEGFFEPPALMVDLAPDEQRALSLAEPLIEALSLASDVLAFWQARLP